MSPDSPSRPDEAIAVETTAVKMLGTREHSRRELERKLGARFADEALIESVLYDLQQRNLLSDERFAETYVEKRSRKGFGPLRIRSELGERGIGADLIAVYLGDGGPDWHALLQATAEQKFGVTPASDRRALAKRGRFLEQRGFPISLIGRYLDRVRNF